MEKKSIPDYYQYWGKARKRDDETYDYHLLVYHCLDVAAVGRVIITSDFFLQQKLIKLTRLSY
ncbi:MAG TPA: HD domain-containing protein, partial [Chitinispirillaceae bacterium]|nr:HD domain-containing protein [Chitinispirillaceae bacterium]